MRTDSGAPAGPPPGRASKAAAWGGPLPLLTIAGTVGLTATGLVVWLWPFGVFAQVSLLLHTVGGMLLAVPGVLYAWRHWRAYRRHPLTQAKFVGYVSLALLAVCALSGVVLTWDALLATRIRAGWRDTHRWVTVGVAVLTAWHLLPALLRDRRVSAAQAGRGLRRLAALTAVAVIVPMLLGAGVAALGSWRRPPAAFAADYELWQPSNPLYADNRPFAPSLARTPGNRPIAAPVLAGSASAVRAGVTPRSCRSGNRPPTATRRWTRRSRRFS
jgi:hypothetical protein